MEKETSLPTLQKLRGLQRHTMKKLYANKLENLDEVAKFVEKHKLSKLTQEEIKYLSIPS